MQRLPGLRVWVFCYRVFFTWRYELELGWFELGVEPRTLDFVSVDGLARLYKTTQDKEKIWHIEAKVVVHRIRDEEPDVAVIPPVGHEL